jgi:hypothetical protein
MGVFKEVSPAY